MKYVVTESRKTEIYSKVPQYVAQARGVVVVHKSETARAEKATLIKTSDKAKAEKVLAERIARLEERGFKATTGGRWIRNDVKDAATTHIHTADIFLAEVLEAKDTRAYRGGDECPNCGGSGYWSKPSATDSGLRCWACNGSGKFNPEWNYRGRPRKAINA